MAFFKNLLSSIGIGSAKVDTIIQGDRFTPGESVDVIVKIMGGNTEQHIDGLYFSIHCNYEANEYAEDEDDTETEVTRTATLNKMKLSDEFSVGPGEEMEIPLSFELPLYTPLTVGKTKVWIHTGLDIKKAIDPGDKDYIEVVPGHLSGALFDSLDHLGFKLVEADCEAVPSSLGSLPFVQEFEFKPFSGPFRGKLDELEIVCFPHEDHMEVFMEIDRKARGIGSLIAEMMDRDETRVNFSYGQDELEGLTDMVRELIDDWS